MKKLLANDTFLKILSLLLAVGLWVFVLYTEKPTTDKEFNDIPVTFEGENTLRDNGLIMSMSRFRPMSHSAGRGRRLPVSPMKISRRRCPLQT